MGAKQIQTTPQLRFPEFKGEWLTNRVDYYLERHTDSVDVEDETLYRQIGVRSHGKGVFHKLEVTGATLGNKRVFWVHPQAFVVNIVFGWEQAVALTSEADNGFVASHRFPMFLPKKNRTDLHFLLTFFLRKKGKHLLDLASPGGAGRNKTLGQNEFAKLLVTLPLLEEQQKIASFLGAVDSKLTTLRRKRELLQNYKRGLMQKIFSRELRFKREDGSDFPDWEEKRLGEVAAFSKGKGVSKSDIVEGGKTPCIRYGQLYTLYKELIDNVVSFTNEAPENLLFSKKNDVIIPASGEAALDIATAACVMKDGVALGGDLNVIRGNFNGVFLSYYLNNGKRNDVARLAQGVSVVHLYGHQLAQVRLELPCLDEQQKIANFLTAIDTKIESVAGQINQVETFKKGLLQKMFV